MKKCNKCKIKKDLSEFNANNRMKDGFINKCKSCVLKARLLTKQTKKGLVASIYESQKRKSKVRGHIPPSYTLFGLRQWFRSNAAANHLYKAWVASGYATNLRPSVDRLDDSKGYSFDNIQLMTWGENRSKSHADIKSGRMKKCNSKAVIQMDADGNFIAEYYSGAEASRVTGVSAMAISLCVNGLRKTAHKYQWSHK